MVWEEAEGSSRVAGVGSCVCSVSYDYPESVVWHGSCGAYINSWYFVLLVGPSGSASCSRYLSSEAEVEKESHMPALSLFAPDLTLKWGHSLVPVFGESE